MGNKIKNVYDLNKILNFKSSCNFKEEIKNTLKYIENIDPLLKSILCNEWNNINDVLPKDNSLILIFDPFLNKILERNFDLNFYKKHKRIIFCNIYWAAAMPRSGRRPSRIQA